MLRKSRIALAVVTFSAAFPFLQPLRAFACGGENAVTGEAVQCAVIAVATGNLGNEGGSGQAEGGIQNSSGGGGASCSFQGKAIPCSGQEGWWNAQHQCYASLPEASLPYDDAGDYLFKCVAPDGGGSFFVGPLSSAGPAAPPPPPDPEELAQMAIKSMELRPIQIGMAPPLGAGKVGVVGLPTWMWVADPGPSTTGPNVKTATVRGYSVTATATLSDITWDMGDGESVSCRAGTPYQPSYGRASSPDCGYTYSTSGGYTVRATSHWTVTWTGMGQQGTVPITVNQEAQLTEVELQAIGQR